MKLSKEDLQQLIETYRSELRLLNYRTKQVAEQLKGLEREERLAKPKRKRGRPALLVTGRNGRPPKSEGRSAGSGSKGGYRLNVWDEIVLKTVGGNKKEGVFSDFFDAARRTPAGKGISQKDLYARVNQSLHKLANKRGILKKVEHEGRGFAYKLTKN